MFVYRFAEDQEVASKRKLVLMKATKEVEEAEETVTRERQWCILELGQMATVLKDVPCPECLNKEHLQMRKDGAMPMGFAEPVHLECTMPEGSYKSDFVYSSPRTNNSARFDVPYDINSVMTMLAQELGKGHAALQKIEKVLGINCMHHSTYKVHQKKVQQACHSMSDQNLLTAANIIRSLYKDLDDDEDIMNTVSFDGTWHKRGFTSHYRVGVAVEIQTGLVVDYEVLSNYCQRCSNAAAKYTHGSVELEMWRNAHTDCDANFEGSSKAMEAEAAKRIWLRSVQKFGFRYINILRDGDASTFAALTRLSPYGPDFEVSKLDCVNHADKRMGTALRKAIKEKKLGGHGEGRLTNSKAAKLQIYYGRAIRSNLGNLKSMRGAVWASLFHSMSSNEDPHHERCPAGPDSWCIFRKAEALGAPMPNHGPETTNTFLVRSVAEQLIPI